MAWTGKSVIVTGGAMGIGRYIALGCAERGANVAVADIDDDGLSAVERELAASGHRTLCAKVDVREEAEVEAFVGTVGEEFGSIDYLVNDAAIVPHFQWGGTRWPRVKDMDFSFWTKVIATNIHGSFLFAKHVIPKMEAQDDGHIVNLYGGGGVTPPGAMAYVLTKEALVVFSRYLAEEVREHNICVMSMSPGGAIATERAPQEARDRMPGPELAGDRFFLAAEAGMEFSGQLVDFVDGQLVVVPTAIGRSA